MGKGLFVHEDTPNAALQNFSDKFRLRVLLVHLQRVTPVFPGPPELVVAQMIRKPRGQSVKNNVMKIKKDCPDFEQRTCAKAEGAGQHNRNFSIESQVSLVNGKAPSIPTALCLDSGFQFSQNDTTLRRPEGKKTPSRRDTCYYFVTHLIHWLIDWLNNEFVQSINQSSELTLL